MNSYVEKFINQLIKKIDKPEGVELECRIRITDHAYRWYFALNNSTKTVLHQTLESIAYLNIHYQRKVALGAFKHIEYIQIVDGYRLMDSQGFIPQADEIKVSFRHLETTVFNVPWWDNTKLEIAKEWSSNKTFCGVNRNQADRLFDAMKVIEWIVQLPVSESVPDIRTLSAMLYGNSKKLECKSFSGLIRKLMLPHIDDDVVDLLDDGVKLLEYFGISKYPIPMRFKANGLLHCRGIIDLSALHYGIGVSPDEVKGIVWGQRPPYVLFIENRASFERYVREIDDLGVIIYTAGFPPRSWVHVIEIIVAELRMEIPIYHWGDRDAGGYRILAFLAKRLDIDIQPYLMGVEAEALTQADDELVDKPVVELMQALESAKHYPAILALYRDLAKLQIKNLPWIEQEQIAPVSPQKY
ncbi:Uncharacterized protein conserved in bacteria C-term(DUF2220) [Citrobacter braakii]|uniref:Wadjet anti-phage system protein JetD domain-containing protein n=1 Tax=Citrobacter braakii TaxID=57706 RepID=UPI000DFFFDD4|nr:Wadjet anti-phage system protein JetD domain-containing protein [Citrobacter braakii]STH95034.1 Uncharacterized protein conserved in bacteria C-term(DUF2220) [Citrobacter braakii]HBE9114715.1 hypothetical protein [Citrobacter braakii]